MTIWVVPEDTWKLDQAQDGDVLVRPQQDAVVLGKVGPEGTDWLGPVPEGALELSPVQEATQIEELSLDIEPLLAAMAERGA